MVTTLIYLLALAFLIFLSGRFSGSETALTSLSKADIASMRVDNEKNAGIIQKLKSDMDDTITTILIGNNLVNITASALATRLAYVLMGDLGVSIAVGILTLLLLVFGEITPKGFAIKNKKRFSKSNAKAIYYLSIVMQPIIRGLNYISDCLIELTGGETEKEEVKIKEEDIRHLASLMEQEGVIKEIERDILHRVFWFGDLKVRSVKIPKEETYAIDSDISVKESSDFIKEHGYTRIPVTKHGTDEVIGILYSKELLSKDEGTVKDFMREPYFVHNDDEITEIFNWMRRKRIHMSIVEDEEGNFDGIITLEDVIEELVGEIYDEFD